MAMVQPKSQKLRLLATHLGLLIFIAAIMFPLLMVIAISLRSGNFATGSLIPTKSPGSTGSLRWASAWSMPMAALPRRRSRYCCGCGTR
ncbi:maltose transporter permease [Enterobacter cloacae]|uniref:Maltose transporter permease n=1 Tax=Enterobacter cloacae TaxID=550 RepID=A0A377LRL5_ENTCL|nr:maltose transporter permease [Enterobacter cloacae]